MEKTMTEKACKECAFYAIGKNSGLGVCRRYPPPPVSSRETPDFPHTRSTWWCGEFQPKEPDEPEAPEEEERLYFRKGDE